jgi:DNA ligase-1
MKRFTELYMELDASNRTTSKLAALKRYFAEVPDADAAWAVYFLTGQRLKRIVKTGELREWAAQASGYPLWMVEECYGHVGDLAETLALLLAGREAETKSAQDVSLHRLVETELLPLRELGVEEQRLRIVRIWDRLGGDACFVFNKLITGGFRVGVSKTLINRALAELAAVEPAAMAHRLMGAWKPDASRYRALLEPDTEEEDRSRPYPFCLAYPLDDKSVHELGSVNDWQIEWKWDGIRAQLIKR